MAGRQKAIGLIFLALAMGCDDSYRSSGARQRLTVAQHRSIEFSTAEVRSRLDEANKKLQKADRESDVACPMVLSMWSDVRTFNGKGILDAYIQGKTQMDRVLGMSRYQVKVVRIINGPKLCGDKGSGSIAGCARRPGDSFVVTETAGYNVWVHEFGHNQGLGHNLDSNKSFMAAQVGPDEVNEAECEALKEGSF